MSDIADDADEHSAPILDAKLKEIHHRATLIPVGEPGECDRCGDEFPRLVNGVCCRCRDKFKLP